MVSGLFSFSRRDSTSEKHSQSLPMNTKKGGSDLSLKAQHCDVGSTGGLESSRGSLAVEVDFDDFDLSDDDDDDQSCEGGGGGVVVDDEDELDFGFVDAFARQSDDCGRKRSETFVPPKSSLVTHSIPPPTKGVDSNSPVLPAVIALLRQKAPDVAKSAIEVLMSTFMHSSATQNSATQNSTRVPQSPHRLSLLSQSPSFSDMSLQRSGSMHGLTVNNPAPNGPLGGVFNIWMPGSKDHRVPRWLVLHRNCLMEYNQPTSSPPDTMTAATIDSLVDGSFPVGCTVLHSQMLLRPAEPMISHQTESSNFDDTTLEFELLCPQNRLSMCRELAHLWSISKSSGMRMLRSGTDLTLDHERTAENLIGVLPLQAFSHIAAFLHGVDLSKVARSLVSPADEQQMNTWTESLHHASMFQIGDFCKLRPKDCPAGGSKDGTRCALFQCLCSTSNIFCPRLAF
jgi:hypothetical protein